MVCPEAQSTGREYNFGLLHRPDSKPGYVAYVRTEQLAGANIGRLNPALMTLWHSFKSGDQFIDVLWSYRKSMRPILGGGRQKRSKILPTTG